MQHLIRSTIIASIFFVATNTSNAQLQKEPLEKRIELLEQLVLQLQQRIVALESKHKEQPEKAVANLGDWKIKSNWRQLKIGQNQDEVKKLLGEPGKVDVGVVLIFWHYGFPSGGNVNFDNKNGTVSGWSEPSK